MSRLSDLGFGYHPDQQHKSLRRCLQFTQFILLLAVILIWILYFLGVIWRTGLFIATATSVGMLIISALVLRQFNLGVIPHSQNEYHGSFATSIALHEETHTAKYVDEVIALNLEPRSRPTITEGGSFCVICLLYLEESHDLIQVVCGHLFHAKCLKNWLCTQLTSQKTRSLTCPICRFTFSTSTHEPGDSVVLYFSINTVVLVPSIQPGGMTHNAWGYFSHEDIIGKRFGCKVQPRMNSENPRPVHVLRVTPELFTLSIPHRTQIIYHADISAIISGLNLLPGTLVAEAGTGSASLSYSIMNSIAPNGKLYTFDNDPSRAQHNRELLSLVSDPGVVTVEERDVIECGFPETLAVDSLFLDLPSPWLVVNHAKKILKENGRICTFSPAIEQVMKNVQALQDAGFHEIRTLEVMMKPWGLDLPKFPSIGDKRKLNSQKPCSFQLPMRGHTSYLTFAIKGLSDETNHPKPILSVGHVRRLHVGS